MRSAPLGQPRLSAAASRLAAPDDLEEVAVPAEQGLGLDEVEGVPPGPVESREQDHEQTVAVVEEGTLDRTTRDDELLTKHRVLGDELELRTGDILHNACHDRHRSGLEEPFDHAVSRVQTAGDGAIDGGDEVSLHALLPVRGVDGRKSMAPVGPARQ